MKQSITPQIQMHSYRLEIRDDETGAVIRTETYHAPTGQLTIERADEKKETHVAS